MHKFACFIFVPAGSVADDPALYDHPGAQVPLRETLREQYYNFTLPPARVSTLGKRRWATCARGCGVIGVGRILKGVPFTNPW